MIRLTAEEKATKVFDELTAAVRLDVHQLVNRTGLRRPGVYQGIRWFRDYIGDGALVCNADGTYELAMTPAAVRDYRERRQKFFVNSLRRLQKILEAGEVEFGPEADTAIAISMIETAAKMLERGMGGGGRTMAERVA